MLTSEALVLGVTQQPNQGGAGLEEPRVALWFRRLGAGLV